MIAHGNDINISLDGNIGKIHFVKIEGLKFTGELAKIEDNRLTFVRRNGAVIIVDRDDLQTLAPIGGK